MAAGVVALGATIAVGTVIGLIVRRREGRLRPIDSSAAASRGLTAHDLAAPLGKAATLVQFSIAFCQPCRATRRILGDVAAMMDGIEYVEVDAESRLDLVRRLGVSRAPTVLVLDSDGRVVGRATGQPRRPDVIAMLGQVATAGSVQSARM